MNRSALKKIEIERPSGFAVFADAGVQEAAKAAEKEALTNVVALVEKVNKTFEAFKAQNEQEIKELKNGRKDVVTTEHTERINAEVGKLSGEIQALQQSITALRIGGGSSNDNDPLSGEKRAYGKGFNAWVRRGTDEEGLRALSVKAALTTDSNQDGGFVISEETMGPMTRVLQLVQAMRQIANVVQIGSDTYRKIHNLAGATSGWVGERDARLETATPKLSEIQINVMELYANPSTTQRMLDDASFDAEAWLGSEIGIQFAEKEGDAFVNGTGVNMPRGILQYPTVANASYTWGKLGYIATGSSGALASAGYDNLVDLYHSLKPGYRANGSWLMSDATLAVIRKVKTTGSGDYIYLPPTATEPGSILGKPAYSDDGMTAIGANSFSIAFGDFMRGYTIADRTGVRVTRDPYTNKPYVMFYTTKRVGGGITDFAAIKLLKFGTS